MWPRTRPDRRRLAGKTHRAKRGPMEFASNEMPARAPAVRYGSARALLTFNSRVARRMTCERRDPLHSLLTIRSPTGERGARSALGLVCGLRWLSPTNAARFARPVAIILRRAWVSALCADISQVPDGVRACHGPGPRCFTCSLPSFRTLRRLSHARSRPSRLDCPASNETSHARDARILTPLATRSD